MKYAHILRRFAGTVWAIDEQKLATMTDFLLDAAAGVTYSAEEVQARIASSRERETAEANGSVAVLPMVGIVSQRGGNMEDISAPMGVSTMRFSAMLQAALEEPAIKAVILDVDSPGGTVDGVFELSKEIFDARGSKPIIAVANSWAASAAYAIASAADELIVTPGGAVGSIGVYMVHMDASKALEMDGIVPTLIHAGKFKGEGHPAFSLSDQAKERLQADVDHYYGMFIDAVARNRGASVKDVRGGFGEGRLVNAVEAVKLGMADRVATLQETIDRFAGPRTAPAKQGKRSTSRNARQLRALELDTLES